MKFLDRSYWEDENKFGEDLICFWWIILRHHWQGLKSKKTVLGEWKRFKIHAKTCSKYEHKKNMALNHKLS